MNKRLKLFLQVVVVLAIFYFMFLQIYRNWDSLKEYEWHFNYIYLILSFVVLLGHTMLVVCGWKFILRKMFVKIEYWKLMKIRALSELGRYLPGMVWHIAGRAYFAKRMGISRLKILASFALELGASVISGLFIFLIGLPFFLETEILIRILPFFIFIPIGFILIHPRIFNKVINFGLRIVKKPKINLHIRYKDILLLILMYSGFWLVIGFAFMLLVNSIYPIGFSKFIIIAAIDAIAWVIGFLVIFVPGGIGVREGIMAGLLSMFMPLPVAIIISLVSRLWAIASELLFAGIVLKIKLK